MKNLTYLILIFSIFACSNDDNNSDEETLTIGDSYQGGIVAYILQSGDPGYNPDELHGLIAAPTDQANAISWNDTSNFITGDTFFELGSGYINTFTIVSYLGTGNYAAKLCYDLEIGGYDDWYLPSLIEVSKLYNNKNAIGGFNPNGLYWTSTSDGPLSAASWDFGSGFQEFPGTNSQNAVRAIRSF